MKFAVATVLLLAATAEAQTLPPNICAPDYQDQLQPDQALAFKAAKATAQTLGVYDAVCERVNGMYKCLNDLTTTLSDASCKDVLQAVTDGIKPSDASALCDKPCTTAAGTAIVKVSKCLAQELDAVTSPNAKSFLEIGTKAIDTFLEKYKKLSGFMCDFNPATSQSCLAGSFGSLQSTLFNKDNFAKYASGTALDQASKDVVCPVLQDAGCCFTAAVDTFVPEATATKMKETLKASCGWTTFPAACPAKGKTIDKATVSFSFKGDFGPVRETLTNAYNSLKAQKTDAFTQKLLALKASIAKDLSVKLGVDLDKILIGDIDLDAAKNLVVKFVNLPKAQEKLDDLVAKIKAKLSGEDAKTGWAATTPAVSSFVTGITMNSALEASNVDAKAESASTAMNSVGSLTPSLAALAMAFYVAFAL